jgi:UDP-N-acetylglucosamine transferase subunit ALG13
MIKNSKKAGVGSLLSQLQNNMSLIIFVLLLYISTLQNHLSHSKIWMALKIVVPLQWILEQNLLPKK